MSSPDLKAKPSVVFSLTSCKTSGRSFIAPCRTHPELRVALANARRLSHAHSPHQSPDSVYGLLQLR